MDWNRWGGYRSKDAYSELIRICQSKQYDVKRKFIENGYEKFRFDAAWHKRAAPNRYWQVFFNILSGQAMRTPVKE